MKRCYSGVLALLFSSLSVAQPIVVSNYPVVQTIPQQKSGISSELFWQLMATEPCISDQEIQDKYQKLEQTVFKLKRKLRKSQSIEQFLKYFFYHIHRTYLKKYQSYATLENLMTDHKYDCVSGTALYALLLDALEIDFTVQEMTYHMYLEIPVEGGKAFIESTDPLSGITLGAEAVAAREAQYQTEEVDPEVYTQPIQAQIGLPQLVGLAHFNAAVNHYTQQQLAAARQHLKRAIQWYPAERMYTFQAIIEALAVR
ncbi:MAG: hypothetical protein ACFB15_04605 [Cyclobacteriaceae bacterium]